tara:strand:- start:2 stop:190 length:189 start_codon:yes stop_codon:yes gene_type:complete
MGELREREAEEKALASFNKDWAIAEGRWIEPEEQEPEEEGEEKGDMEEDADAETRDGDLLMS